MSKKSALVESSLYGHNMKVANPHEMAVKADKFDDEFEFVTPVELSVMSHEIMPHGLPVSSSAFIIDKIEVAFCDGEDHWYLEADKPVDAGKPWSALFE